MREREGRVVLLCVCLANRSWSCAAHRQLWVGSDDPVSSRPRSAEPTNRHLSNSRGATLGIALGDRAQLTLLHLRRERVQHFRERMVPLIWKCAAALSIAEEIEILWAAGGARARRPHAHMTYILQILVRMHVHVHIHVHVRVHVHVHVHVHKGVEVARSVHEATSRPLAFACPRMRQHGRRRRHGSGRHTGRHHPHGKAGARARALGIATPGRASAVV